MTSLFNSENEEEDENLSFQSTPKKHKQQAKTRSKRSQRRNNGTPSSISIRQLPPPRHTSSKANDGNMRYSRNRNLRSGGRKEDEVEEKTTMKSSTIKKKNGKRTYLSKITKCNDEKKDNAKKIKMNNVGRSDDSTIPGVSPYTSSSYISSQSTYSQGDNNNNITIPSDWIHPNDLKWHVLNLPASSVQLYFPCRVIQKPTSHNNRKEANNNGRNTKTKNKSYNIINSVDDDNSYDSGSSNDSDSDEDDQEVQIEYISYNVLRPVRKARNKRYKTISKKRLLPYHGQENEDDLDHNDIIALEWCPNLYTKYQVQQNSIQDRKMCIKLDIPTVHEEIVTLAVLNEVLLEVKQRSGFTSNSYDSSYGIDMGGDIHDDDLEEPYTQALDFKPVECNSSDEEMEEFYRDLQQKSSPPKAHMRKSDKYVNNTEPIRPGDVIEYYHPLFIFGDKRGLRTATVISVDPKNRNSVLTLNNGESLPIDVKVRRIKTLFTEQKTNQRTLIDHKGVFREIQEFKLVKLNPIKGYDIPTERDRVNHILQKNMKECQDKLKASGFAVTDMLNDFGSKKRSKINQSPQQKLKQNNNSKSPSSESDDELKAIAATHTNRQRRKPRNQSQQSKNSVDGSSSESDDELKAIAATHGRKKSSMPRKQSQRHKIPKDDASSECDEKLKAIAASHGRRRSPRIARNQSSRIKFLDDDASSESDDKMNHISAGKPKAHDQGNEPLLSLKDTDDENGIHGDDNSSCDNERLPQDDPKKDRMSSLAPQNEELKRMELLHSLGLSDSDDDDLDSPLFPTEYKETIKASIGSGTRKKEGNDKEVKSRKSRKDVVHSLSSFDFDGSSNSDGGIDDSISSDSCDRRNKSTQQTSNSKTRKSLRNIRVKKSSSPIVNVTNMISPKMNNNGIGKLRPYKPTLRFKVNKHNNSV